MQVLQKREMRDKDPASDDKRPAKLSFQEVALPE